MKTCNILDSDNPNSEQIQKLQRFVETQPTDKQFEDFSNKLKGLSDPTRLKILYLLSEGELCVCEIMYALDKPQSSISHHLNILKNMGFIKSRKEGVWTHYKLKNPEITNIVKNLIEIIK